MSSGEMARYYRTDSRVAGVRVDDLPHSLRVRHVAHEDFSGSATLEYDEERRDHCLTKVEAIPGLREENDWGFSWFDPVSGEERGGLVAFPPHEWSSWDFKRRAWCRQPTSAMASPRLSEARAVWPAMGGPLPEGRVACRPFAWEFTEAKPGSDRGGPAFKGVRFGEIVGHSFTGSPLYGGVATWEIRFDAEPEDTYKPENDLAGQEVSRRGRRSSSLSRSQPNENTIIARGNSRRSSSRSRRSSNTSNGSNQENGSGSGSAQRRSSGEAHAGAAPAAATPEQQRRSHATSTTTTICVSTPELRAALDLRHHLCCNLAPPPEVAGWSVIQSRSTREYYFAQAAAGSQWHRPGLNPSVPSERERCRASCAIWGHRSKANIFDHKERMARVKRNFEFKDEKLERWRREGNGRSYYEWCVASIRESTTFEEFRRIIGEASWDEQRCIQGLLALRRDYDHIASDSDLSESDDSDSESGSDHGGNGGWQPFDADLLGGSNRSQHPAANWIAPHKKRPRSLDPLVSEAISCYVESPGFASRLLHHDGSNRTRSGARFGGRDPRRQLLVDAEEKEAGSSSNDLQQSSTSSSSSSTNSGAGVGEEIDESNASSRQSVQNKTSCAASSEASSSSSTSSTTATNNRSRRSSRGSSTETSQVANIVAPVSVVRAAADGTASSTGSATVEANERAVASRNPRLSGTRSRGSRSSW